MKKIIGLALASLGVLLLTACSPVGITGSAESESTIAAAVEPIGDDSHNPLDMLEFTLPDEISACRDSNSQETFWRNEEQVGGIFLLEHGNEVFDDILNYQETVSPLILDAMEKMGKPRFEWYVSNSSFYGIMETNMGIEKEEYIAYVVRGYSACYVVWFDRNQVSSDEEISIMQSLSSDDITEELNTISSQAYADAVAESMAKNEYQFEITLPSNIKSEEQTEEGGAVITEGESHGMKLMSTRIAPEDYDEYGIYYASDLYRKDEDGTTTAYMRDVDNKILSSPLYVNESQTVEAPWDTYFYNPFGKLEVADLTLGENGYAVSAAKVQAFSIPLMHYAVGTFDTATVARLGDTLSITLGATDERGDPMEMKLELAVTTGDREVPAPFETEAYHDAIGKALDTWTLALSGPNDPTGFVYEKTMTPLGRDDIEVAHSRSTVTYNATLFANDGGITSANDWGYALYDDGKYYEFEIVDGEPVRGEAYDGEYYPMPFPNIVAPEMFVPTDEEGTYVYRDGPSSLSAASLFLEDESVVAFLA